MSALLQSLLNADYMLRVCYAPCPLPSQQHLIAPATLLLVRLSLNGHIPNTACGQALKSQGRPLDDHWPSEELGSSSPCGEF